MARSLLRLAVAVPMAAAGCVQDSARQPSSPLLTGEVIAAGDYLDQPTRLAVAANRLVVLDRSAPKVHTFRVPDGERLASFGQSGEGPGEYRSAWQLQHEPGDRRDVWIFDMELRRMTRLRFGAEPVPQVQEVVNLDAGGGVFMHPVWLTDTTLVVSGIFPLYRDGRLLLANRTGGVVRMLGKAPRHPGDATIPTTVLQHAYEGPVTVRPDRSRFAIATRHGDRLELFAADGTQTAEVTGSTGFLPRFAVNARAEGVSMATGDDLRGGYVGLASTDNRIYALFSGVLARDAPRSVFFGREVHVFDWSGKIVTRLRLDEPGLGIAITPDGKQFFTIRHDPAPSIVRYSLPAAAWDG